MDLRVTIATRLVQCLFALALTLAVGIGIWVLMLPYFPGLDTLVLCSVIGHSTMLVVITVEVATTRIIQAVGAHPQAFAAVTKSQRSESKATKA